MLISGEGDRAIRTRAINIFARIHREDSGEPVLVGGEEGGRGRDVWGH